MFRKNKRDPRNTRLTDNTPRQLRPKSMTSAMQRSVTFYNGEED